MKIQYMSDLHLECSDLIIEKNGDVLVIAGDIFNASSVKRFEGFIYRAMELGYEAILFVIGNHEGYGWTIPEARQVAQKTDDMFPKFHLLDRSGVLVNGQRFIGASLWSNPSQNAAIHARLYINDYKAISQWTIDDHVREHIKDLRYLSLAIKEGDVVITHFPPTANGIDQLRFGGDILNGWFTNKLSGLIERKKPQLWISGHTHYCWDELVGVTRDVGNCRGYTRVHHGTGQMTGEVKAFSTTRAITIEVTDKGPTGAAS